MNITVPAQQDLQGLFALIQMVSDPNAAKQAAEQLLRETQEAQKLRAEANLALAEAQRERAGVEKARDEAQSARAESLKLRDEAQRIDSSFKDREKALAQGEATLKSEREMFYRDREGFEKFRATTAKDITERLAEAKETKQKADVERVAVEQLRRELQARMDRLTRAMEA